MAVLEFPWDPLSSPGADFFDKITRHWPHYQSLSFTFSLAWSAVREVEFEAVYEGEEIECEATTATDTSSGSCTGTVTWSRQSEADENSEQSLAANLFRMRITFEEFVSETPRIDSALFHFIQRGTFTNPTGSWSQTVHSGDACDIISTTTTGTITSDITVAGVGVYESGTGEWFATAETGVSFFGASSPFGIPSLQGAFLDGLTGAPEGATITFDDSGSATTGSDGWTGSCGLSFTLTLST